MLFILKVIVNAVLIGLTSEIAKHNRLLASLLISLPLTSLLTFIWVYLDTKDIQKIATLSYDIMWMVLASPLFFLTFPLFVKYGFNFWVSLLLSSGSLIGGYFLIIQLRS